MSWSGSIHYAFRAYGIKTKTPFTSHSRSLSGVIDEMARQYGLQTNKFPCRLSLLDREGNEIGFYKLEKQMVPHYSHKTLRRNYELHGHLGKRGAR